MKFQVFTAAIFAATASSQRPKPAVDETIRAVSVLRGSANVSGTVTFEQKSPCAPTNITYNIIGYGPNVNRGFHVHTFGDLTDGCVSAGPHYNPLNATHGAPEDKIRHVGDLGNIRTDARGVAQGTMMDDRIQLSGPHSVIGRAVVVHGSVDDLGRSSHHLSLQTGNSGGRSACDRRYWNRYVIIDQASGVPQEWNWQQWIPKRQEYQSGF